jgi:ATP-dependent helicase HrpB
MAMAGSWFNSAVIAQNLPVETILPDLCRALALHDDVVLQAPPGAGKTTLVPLALATEPWLGHRRILILEPRRIATRTAALRMASLLGEAPGETVGYRMRLETRVSARTKIEVITEGILTRMLQDDPSLAEVGLVIFDEFHERNLESDLALSLCLKSRELFRQDGPPLKLLVMSATLDGGRITQLLDGAPLIQSLGRQYPVEVIYGKPSQPRESIVDRTVQTVVAAALANTGSSLLVFLPGQGEIVRTADGLATALPRAGLAKIDLRPLYGNLPLADQVAAIAPVPDTLASQGHRKIVLATNIAETSLTIEGVDVVVDSGLVREPVFDPGSGMTRLQTRKISGSSSIQRMGRAGRLRPGKCYRLWSGSQQQQLAPHTEPEILAADLASLAVQLLRWGVDDPAELRWLDPPPAGHWLQAIELLTRLNAVTSVGGRPRLTVHGEAMASLPVHPRLGHLLIRGVETGYLDLATLLAAFLSDRDPFQDDPDIEHRLDILTDRLPCPPRQRGWRERTRQLARQFRDQLTGMSVQPLLHPLDAAEACGYLLACAYPDRIARLRHSGGYQLANGRSAAFAAARPLGKHQWLAVAKVTGSVGSKGDTIRTAASLDPALFETLLSDLVSDETRAEWDKRTGRFHGERERRIGALVLQKLPEENVTPVVRQVALTGFIREQGLGLLPWTTPLRQWQARVKLLRQHDGAGWPDVSNEALAQRLDVWLEPYLLEIRQLGDFKRLDLSSILQALLSFDQQKSLDALAPARWRVPSGSHIAIDYLHSPPVLAVKLQEMFGCDETPQIVRGKVPLLVHLLSPAGRPLQITQDLAGFWLTGYQDVRKEMKGRYPKHPWPDDPGTAPATNRTKGRTP